MLTQHQGFLTLPTNSWGSTKSWEGSTATTADLRGIPDYMASSPVYKAGGEERGDIQRNGVALPTHVTWHGTYRKW